MEMKAKVVQANQAGLDNASRSSLRNAFVSLRDQISIIVATAEFNGTNLVNASAATTSVLSTIDGSTIADAARKMDATTLAIQSQVPNTSSGAATALTAIDPAVTQCPTNSRLWVRLPSASRPRAISPPR